MQKFGLRSLASSFMAQCDAHKGNLRRKAGMLLSGASGHLLLSDSPVCGTILPRGRGGANVRHT